MGTLDETMDAPLNRATSRRSIEVIEVIEVLS